MGGGSLHFREGLLLLVATALVVGACSGGDSVGQIAFTSERDGNFEVYAIDTDGSNLTQLTENPAEDDVPAWSPDGTKITFYSDRDGNFEVYVMDADGSNQTRLTDNPAADAVPEWSPVG
jgi:TolB protein